MFDSRGYVIGVVTSGNAESGGRVVYAISAGIQNQNQATNAAMMITARNELLARIPASVVK